MVLTDPLWAVVAILAVMFVLGFVLGPRWYARRKPAPPTVPSADRMELLRARSQWERLVEEAASNKQLTPEQRATFIEEARRRIDEINKQLTEQMEPTTRPSEAPVGRPLTAVPPRPVVSPRVPSSPPAAPVELPVHVPRVISRRTEIEGERGSLQIAGTRVSVRNGLIPSEILDIDAWGSDTVGSVKSQACQALGLDPSASFLAYKASSLSDNMKLDDIPIPAGAELLIMVTGVVGCVVEGTRITLRDNSHKGVEDLWIGDAITSYHSETESVVYGVVVENQASKASVILDVNDGLLRATQEQPILIKNRGWVVLRDLKVGDSIFSGLTKTWIEVRSIDVVRGIFNVYNPKVKPIDNYLANGILVDSKPTQEREVPAQGARIFQDVAAQATVPLEMAPERSHAVRITLRGEKVAPHIEVRVDSCVETKSFKAYPTKTLNIRAEATAFRTSPQVIQTLVPLPGESSEHDFLVTPKQGYEGKQKLLFQISQESIHLATLNADIEVKGEPRSILSEIETKFSAISKGLTREYEAGDLPAILAQYMTTDIISKLNSKDYEETRYLLILLLANQPPYRSRGVRAKKGDTYAFGKAGLEEVALEALKPLTLKFEYFRGANRVLEDRLEKTFGYVESFKDEKNFTWYFLTSKGIDEGLKGIENLLVARYDTFRPSKRE